MVKKIRIHPEGPELSQIILGAWRWNDGPFSEKEQTELLNTCMEKGITTFDHADIYGNYQCELLFGKLLQNDPALRDKVELVTKCGIMMVSNKYPEREIGHYDTSFNHIVSSAERSLKALHTDYLDVLLIHRPDPLMNADEVARAFHTLKEEGKVKFFGVSNFTNEQFSLLQSRLDFPLVTNQIEISMKMYDSMFDGTLEYLQEKRVSPMAWSPLGGGKVFGDRPLITKLNMYAKKYGVSVGALMLAWLMRHPSQILPVIGTTKASRVMEMAEAAQLQMDLQDWFIILKYIRGFDVP